MGLFGSSKKEKEEEEQSQAEAETEVQGDGVQTYIMEPVSYTHLTLPTIYSV